MFCCASKGISIFLSSEFGSSRCEVGSDPLLHGRVVAFSGIGGGGESGGLFI
jgi:hypothetical protein